MIRIIIIDDEPAAREIIREYLAHCTDVVVAAEYPDGFTGLKGIQEIKPDLVFLDIQMPKLTGFEMLELLETRPEIIFTTAYDQYAIKAFEQNAADYLLKPFSRERFEDALNKVRERIATGKSGLAIDRIIADTEGAREPISRIAVKARDGIRLIPLEHIFFLEAQDDYVMICLKEEKFLKQKTMHYFETHLPVSDFIRVHRSYIVRLDQIVRVEPYEKSNGIAVLRDGRKVPVSRSGLSRLKELLDR
jgi:two-component system LytT family response regulator